MSTPNTNLQTYRQKGISHVMSGTIFFICSTSPISALSFRLSGFQLDQLHQRRKGLQEQKRHSRIVAKSKPTTMNLVVPVSTGSSTLNSPIASKSPGILKTPRRTDWSSTGKPGAGDRNHDAASSSQGSQKDAFYGRKYRGNSSRQKKTRNTWVSLASLRTSGLRL